MRTENANRKDASSRPSGPSGRRGSRLADWCAAEDPWRLPSGQGLIEFALHAGIVAPVLLPPDEARDDGEAAELAGRPGGADRKVRVAGGCR